MKFNSICGAALAATASLYNAVQAQDFATHGIYTEPNTGMKFYGSFQANSATPGQMLDGTSQGGFIEGVALPPGSATTDANEFIGLIVGSTPKGRGQGWAGVTQGHEDQEGFMWAGMVGHLMVVAWPTGTGDEIKSSLRYSVAFEAPVEYKGSARLTPLYSKVNATNWTFIYRCVGCFTFDDTNLDASRRGRAYTSKGSYLKGYAQALFPVDQPSNALSSMAQHDNGAGWYMVDVASAIQPSYSSWITPTTTSRSAGPTTTSTRPVTTTTGRPVTTTTGRPVTTTTTVNTPTTSAGFVSNPVPTTTYDYVVVGSGAGGIPVAEKLAASGKSVLLIEKGVASSARHGGTIRPPTGWLDGTNLTWFDVPGQCNRIWNGGSSGVACSDVDQMTGCILGGGTAINAGVWWRPNPKDWDFLFPTGWKASDMAAATARVFARIPGTDLPSMDGKRYLLEGFNVVKSGLLGAGYKQITLNNEPGNKNRTFGHTPYMFANGERGGPQATYLVQSKTRSNFKLWLNTTVDRIERVGGHATGLVVRASNNGGYAGVVKLTPITGRVIVAGGAFGTAKLLFRSGIGPQDQLDVVKASTDGPNMINSTQWIKTPVGYNLDDHLNTDLVLVHPDVKPYNWPASWDAPIEADKQLYFKSRSGPQAQAAPNIGPIIFEEITGTDGIVRQFQWQARVEGSRGVRNDTAMTLSIWAGRGKKSRGRATISPLLNMQVAQIPYGDPADMAALAKAIDNIVAALKPVPGLTWVYPPPGQNGAAYLATIPLNVASVGERRSNHWIGTAKIGTNPGPQGGDAVVDLDTKVYGTDNIFVVDGSIFPGIMTTNPSALIVTVAEKASDRILALPANRALNKFEQCGGLYYSGSMACGTGSSCSYVNDYYSQCL